MEGSTRGNKLYNASINGDINFLYQLLEEDRSVLGDYGSSVGFCLNGTPLHIAAARGHLKFAEVLLQHKPQLVWELDSRSRTPLHLAVSNGKVEMVQFLLEQTRLADNDIRLMTDELGRTPLHLAVLMNARPQVVKDLITKKPEAIADLLSSSKTVGILHSYILRNDVNVLEIIVSEASKSVESLLCSQDEEGNTILHRVISLRNKEMLEYLIPKNENNRYPIAVNLTNRNNLTVLDLIQQMPMDSKTMLDIRKRFTMHPDVDTEEKNWFDNRKNSMMIAVTLIAGMSYQSGLNPPGGVWDDDKLTMSYNGHTAIAGTSIMSLMNPRSYDMFLICNTFTFVTALLLLLLLLMHGSPRKYVNRRRIFLKRIYIGMCTCILWLTGVSVALAYGTATFTITAQRSSALGIAVVCLLALFAVFLIFSFGKGIYHLARFIKKIVMKLMKKIQGKNNGTIARCCSFV